VKDLLDAITVLIAEMSPEKISSLANLLGSLSGVEEASKLSNWASTPSIKKKLGRMIDAWRQSRISPKELVAMMLGASHAYYLAKNEETVEMVWTGPRTEMVASRHTEQVFLEVIAAEKRKIFIVSYVAFAIDSIIEGLNEAIDKNVEVEILFESSSDHGGKISTDSIEIFHKKLPSAKIYAWDEDSKKKSACSGSVHAKCVVADANVAFITSANLTGAALEWNMELGVLVHGGTLPETLYKHLKALITTEVIAKI